MRHQRILGAGTTAHYEDARYYDHAYSRRREDVNFYVELGVKHGGPVLELGVGTGRVAIELARRGVEIVGVDSMQPMLDRAKERVAKEAKEVRERITLRRGDLRRVRLGRRFPLVISPFNVFMHLYTREEVERALETVGAHLAPGGTFVFDVLFPAMRGLIRDPAHLYKLRPVLNPTTKVRSGYGESFDYDPVSQVQLITTVFDDPEEGSYVVPIAHRQFFPAELEALLHYNGFEVRARHGDWDGSPLGPESDSQIIVARRKPAKRRGRR